MSANIIDGKHIASEIRSTLRSKIADLHRQGKRAPTLAVVLVGDDPASHVYVANKEKACRDVGIIGRSIRLEASTSQTLLNNHLRRLNADPDIDGILLQLPIPRHLNREEALDLISPAKDVDGLSPQNQGLLVCNRPGLFSCTPLGCMELIRSTGIKIEGKMATVIGRSLLVGSPVRTMLINAGATVTTVHTKTVHPEAITRTADILVVAAGVKEMVKKNWVKRGAIVIDVGMHRDDNNRLTGDVDYTEVKAVASYITPVPGGVGPMTIAMLLANCLMAYEMIHRPEQPPY